MPNKILLLQHYKMHNYFKYHCMFCTHGAAQIKDLHAHLATSHFNQPPTILERTLPREVSLIITCIYETHL